MPFPLRLSSLNCPVYVLSYVQIRVRARATVTVETAFQFECFSDLLATTQGQGWQCIVAR